MIALALSSGALLGLVHVFTGPDHLAAIAPLTSDGSRRTWLTGLRWGLGHSGGVALVALAALFLRDSLPIEALSGWSERAVGVVLIGLGVWGFLRLMARNDRGHAGVDAAHEHGRAAFAIGTLHGLAGSSHLLGVLPAIAQPTRADSLAFLGGFACGTVAAMGLFAYSIGWIATCLRQRGEIFQRQLCGFASAAAVGVGLWWLS